MTTANIPSDERGVTEWAQRVGARTSLRLWLLITRADSEPIEIFNALVLMWWGIVYILPTTTRGDDSVIAPLIAYAPDWAWGSLMVLVAMLNLWGVLVDGAITRRLAMYISVFWWAAFTTKFGLEFGANIRLGSTGILAVLCAWAAWRVRPWEDG